MLTKTTGHLLLTCLLWSEVTSQTVTTVTYTGTLTTIMCPAQGNYTLPSWTGPPNAFQYTLTGSVQFNPSLSADKLARLVYADNQRDISLNNTVMGDAGEYTCFITSQFVAVNNLSVRVLSAEPEITTTATVDNYGVRATEGESLAVTCTSRGGNPAPTVVWYNGSITGPELVRTSTGTPAGDGTYTVTLSHTFTPSRQDDKQQLVCRSYYPRPINVQGSQKKAVTLYLYLKPLQPSFPKVVSVVTGGTVNATCITTGSRPAADISWMYRGQTYTSSVTPIEDQSSQTYTVVSVLQRTVNATDNGQTVQCRVTHRALKNTLTVSKPLDVQFPVEQSTSKLMGNTTIEANGENPLALTCTTGSSNPASNITWRKGSDYISNSNAYTDTLGTNNGIVRSQVLTLRPTRYDDGDTISCSVSNGLLLVTDITSTVLNMHYTPLIADMTDTNVTEGDRATLKCNASSKPVASFTWKKGSATVDQGTGTDSYNGYDYTISTVNRTQAGIYTCTADNQLSLTDSKHSKLTVLYPPDIAVVGVNTTVDSQSTTVTCEASGVPDQYEYVGWVHMWGDQILTHKPPLPTTRVLTLTDLSYAHSGMYTCGASNGVKGVSHGSGGLLVKSYPVIVGEASKTNEIKSTGQLKQPIIALLHYYSNAGRGSVKVYRNSGATEEVGDVSYRNVTIKLPVFLSEINIPGTEAIISITVKDDSQFGSYEVRVSNEIGAVILALVIQPQGPPESPLVVNVTVLDHHSVNVTWISGFPNGFNQTFVIQYSTDNTTWRNISVYGGMSSKQAHSKVIQKLASSQSYYLRLISTNDKGDSEPTDIFDFVTEAEPEPPESQSSVGVIAGAAGGGGLALIIILVVLVILWRRKAKHSSSKTKDKGSLVESSNENIGYDDRDDRDEEVINRLYESAGPQQTGITLAATTNKQTQSVPDSANIYAKVNKKPEVLYAMPVKGKSSEKLRDNQKGNEMDLYALPDKSKGKKTGKTPNKKAEKTEKDAKKTKGKKEKTIIITGDVYENAPRVAYPNNPSAPAGNNIYEDTNISVPPETTKKPVRADGLLYADLEFKTPPKGKNQNKIIGIEDRCEYTTIDLTKKAKPLPDGDDAEKHKL